MRILTHRLVSIPMARVLSVIDLYFWETTDIFVHLRQQIRINVCDKNKNPASAPLYIPVDDMARPGSSPGAKHRKGYDHRG